MYSTMIKNRPQQINIPTQTLAIQAVTAAAVPSNSPAGRPAVVLLLLLLACFLCALNGRRRR